MLAGLGREVVIDAYGFSRTLVRRHAIDLTQPRQSIQNASASLTRSSAKHCIHHGFAPFVTTDFQQLQLRIQQLSSMYAEAGFPLDRKLWRFLSGSSPGI